VARSSRRSFARPFKPSGEWAGFFVPNTTIPGNSKVLLGTIIPGTGSGRLTIRRMRISLMWSSDSLAATEFPIGALGAAVFNDTSIAAGVASLPDPMTDLEDDIWFLYQGLHSRFSFLNASGTNSDAGTVYEIDSKAMRHLPDGRSIGVIVATGDAQGAQVQVIVRAYFTLARG